MASDEKWLQALEKKVGEAAVRIRKLREENAALEKKAGELEKRLAAATTDEAGAKGWEKERDEVRDRVEKLTESLERLLE